MNHKALERRIKRHILAAEHSVFLAIQPGLEEAGEKELRKMGLSYTKEKERGSLLCTVSLEDLWKVILLGRSFSRAYLRVASIKAEGFKAFKEKCAAIPWELYLKEGCSYRLKISTAHCRLHVHDKIAKALQHSLQERFAELEGRSPSVETKEEEDPAIQTIILRGVDDRFSVSLDAGGGPLYERGYKQYINEAPLKENIAAALLILADLNENTMVIDPMTGSGSFGMEALGISSVSLTAPEKIYPFEYWSSFRPGRFAWLKKTLEEEKKTPCPVSSSDIDQKSLDASSKNRKTFLKQTKLDEAQWTIDLKDFLHNPAPTIPEDMKGLLILNPPYGLRLPLKDKINFFKEIGQKIRKDYADCSWGIIVPDGDCEKALGLKEKKKYRFKNGGFPVSYLLGD